MAAKQLIDVSSYGAILATKQALRFDAGGLLMRIYVCMSTMGVLTMLSLSGYNFFVSGTVASTIAVATFLAAPLVSKAIDAKGQLPIALPATIVTLVGLGGLITNVIVGGPWWLCYPFSVLMGFIPMPHSLVRARWSYLVRTGRLGEGAPPMQTVLSYEGVLDDVSFMFGPSISIALAAALFPTAGMIFGWLCLGLGALILLSSRDTEPEVGWERVVDTSSDDQVSEGVSGALKGADKPARLAVVAFPVVALTFLLMSLQGAHFGVFDSSLVAFVEEIGWTEFASILLPPASIISIVTGLVFGMLRLTWKPTTQLMVTSCLLGVGFGCIYFVSDLVSLTAIYLIAAFTFAPFIITLNALVERSVPSSRLTESLTWLNTGNTVGMALGPTLAGIVIDSCGSLAGFQVAGFFAMAVPVVALCALPYLRKTLER